MKKAKAIELLAPARDLATGIEAIRHGADAVYIGAPKFGARAAAGNSIEDIRKLVGEAHIYGVKIYVTLNTLLHDEELAEARRLIHELTAIGVDALIVQDLKLVTSYKLRDIPLHASTQMDNQTAEKVEWLWQMGFRQTVLARELTLDEIREIHERVPQMALEVFVHGAICVCYNGRCFASEHCFGRSANRGECAQFCRLPFDLIEEQDGRSKEQGGRSKGQEGTTERILMQQKHLLSLRDMNRSADLEALLDAGVSSLKIEGRLKDTGYVKNVVAYYRRQLDEIFQRRPEYQRSSLGHETITFTPDPAKSFNRLFTDYFLHGRTPDMANIYTPKSMGEAVTSQTEIHNGDGLCYINKEGVLEGFRVNRVDGDKIIPNSNLSPITPHLTRLTSHQSSPTPHISHLTSHLSPLTLYRNHDQEFEQQLSKSTAIRKIGVEWRLRDTEEGFLLRLTREDGAVIEQSFTYPHEQARSPQQEQIAQQLSRLGDTPYEATSVHIELSDNWFIPRSVLAEWRRSMVNGTWDGDNGERREIAPAEEAAGCETTPPYIPSGATSPTPINALIEQQRKPDEPGLLMTCRYCIRHELGICPKSAKAKDGIPNNSSPLFLRLSDGRRFRLLFDCKHCLMKVFTICLAIIALVACKPSPSGHAEAVPRWGNDTTYLEESKDISVRHYGVDYNFLLAADSLVLQEDRPMHLLIMPEMADTFVVYKDDPLVVAQIEVIPEDSIDSIWVKVARDQVTQGWVHETELLQAVVPNAPISQGIHLFSDAHVIATLSLCIVALSAWLLRRMRRRRYHLVHIDDIASPYPMLLCLAFATTTVLYNTIQMFVPELWASFYFAPTLNPFGQPTLLALFLTLAWLIVILTIASLDDVRRSLPATEAMLYALSLLAILAGIYLVFSLATQYFLGYFLLMVYIATALWQYLRRHRPRFRCGHCDAPLHDLGACPKCGTMNGSIEKQ